MEKVYKYSREIIIVTFLLNTLAELAMIMSLYTPVYKKARVLAAQLQLEHAAGAAQIMEQYYKTDSICIAICLALNLVLILVMFVLHENDVISRDRLVKQYEARLTEKNNEVMRYAKYTSVGRVTTDIIHQWKQPLNRLMLLISNLEDSILSGEEDEVTVLELSGEAKETVRLLSDTITEFRSVLAHDGCNSFFSLEEAVQYVLNIFATRIRENNILCEVRIEADLEIFGKKSILIQAIMNLVDNAVDAIVEREEEATEQNYTYEDLEEDTKYSI
ncbi:MAG: sensor histidine kinase, partial [Lachnospiraceae bacterium]|nr:sensor histidine kinase [Lachnospiraceae bacterium]